MNRELSSFKQLTRKEANSLIDILQTALGQESARGPYGKTAPDRNKSSRKKQRGREAAEAAGREGRRGDRGAATLAGPDEIAMICEAKQRLGWDEKRFEAWLRSPSSPLGKRAQPAIRTVGDANKVWWAMKRLLKSAGKWNER